MLLVGSAGRYAYHISNHCVLLVCCVGLSARSALPYSLDHEGRFWGQERWCCCHAWLLEPTSLVGTMFCTTLPPHTSHCRCLDTISPLLQQLFDGHQPASPAASDAAPQQQQQQQQQRWRQQQQWRLLQAQCYQLLNELVEGSCIDADRQLLVLPVCLTEQLQELVAAEVCITGE